MTTTPAKMTPEQEAKMINDGKIEREEMFARFCDTTSIQDSARIKAVFDHQMRVLRHQRWLANQKKMNNVNKGEPLEDKGFLKWTDISTSRWESIVENVFGESIQFHQRFHRRAIAATPWPNAVSLLFAISVERMLCK